MTCAEVHDLIAARPSGALEDDEEQSVSRHLEGCPDCTTQASSIAEAFASLAETIPAPAPPEHVWQRVKASLAQPVERPRRPRAIRAPLLAAGLVLIGSAWAASAVLRRDAHDALDAATIQNLDELHVRRSEVVEAERATSVARAQVAEVLSTGMPLVPVLEKFQRAENRYETFYARLDPTLRIGLAPPRPLDRPTLARVLERAHALRAAAKTPSEWREVERLYTVLIWLGVGERNKLENGIEECRANAEGEELYAQALEIVQQRDPTRYDEAVALLQKIDPSGRVHPDARGVVEWIRADIKVRQARDAYDAMNIERAVRLLDEATAVASIGADAKKAIQERRERWLQVAKVFEVGRAAYEGATPDFPKAEKAFQQVIQLETSRTNRHHMFARKYLSFIGDSYKQSLEDSFKRGVDALKRTPPDLDDAFSYFHQTLNKANGTNKDQYRRAIEKEVNAAAAKGKWLDKATEAFMKDDVSQYPVIREVSKLLRDWLPAGHEDKQRAAEIFKKVSAHDRVVEKNAAEGER